MPVAVLVLLFLVLIVLPFLPGIIELRRPKDDRPLSIPQDNSRHPRHFALTFRGRVAPRVDGAQGPFPVITTIDSPDSEPLEIHEGLDVTDRARGIVASLGDARIAVDAVVDRAYARGDAEVERGARINELAVEGALTLAPGVKVERWVDAGGDLVAGTGSNLGVSASSACGLRVASGCNFERLWGLPITTSGDGSSATVTPPPDPSIDRAVVWARKWLSIPAGTVLDKDLVVYGELHIGTGSTILGSVKAHGNVLIGRGVHVTGNVISRRDITIAGGTEINGNIFSEGNLVVGAETRIGAKGDFKTAYSSKRTTLGGDVTIFGWLIAEGGGSVG